MNYEDEKSELAHTIYGFVAEGKMPLNETIEELVKHSDIMSMRKLLALTEGGKESLHNELHRALEVCDIEPKEVIVELGKNLLMEELEDIIMLYYDDGHYSPARAFMDEEDEELSCPIEREHYFWDSCKTENKQRPVMDVQLKQPKLKKPFAPDQVTELWYKDYLLNLVARGELSKAEYEAFKVGEMVKVGG